MPSLLHVLLLVPQEYAKFHSAWRQRERRSYGPPCASELLQHGLLPLHGLLLNRLLLHVQLLLQHGLLMHELLLQGLLLHVLLQCLLLLHVWLLPVVWRHVL